MKKTLFATVASLAIAFGAHAQSVPFPISLGTVWTPAQWNAAWQDKQDYPPTTAIPLFTWTTAARPLSPSPGWLGYNSTNNQVEYWNGTAWTAPGGSGTINAGAQYSLTYYSASGSATTLSAISTLGTSGQVLTSQGGAAPPHWTNASACTPGGANCVGWFNVVSYGADPTGATDSTTAIAAAVTAIGSGGGVLYFPTGTYKFSTISITNPGIYIRGDGLTATVLAPTAGSGDAITFGTTSASITIGVGISDLQIAPSGARSSGYLVHAENIQDFLASDIFMYTPAHSYGFNGLGIDCYGIPAGCYTDHIVNVQFAGMSHNSFEIGANSTSGPPADIFLNNINIGASGNVGLAVDWVSGLYASAVEAGGGVHGIGMFPGTGKWVFDAWFDQSQGDANSSHGWYLSGAGFFADVHIFNSWGSSNTVNGLYVDTSSVNLTGLQVNGGAYNNNGQFGLLFNAGKNITVTGLHAGSNSQSSSGTYSGVAFGGTATQFSAMGVDSGLVGYPCIATGSCSSTPIQKYGIDVSSGSNNDYVVMGDILLNNVTDGLHDAGGVTKFVCNNVGTAVTANCGGGTSGTINSGTSGQLAYYATTGTTLSGTSTPTVTQLTATGSGNIAFEMSANNGLYCTSGCSSGNQNIAFMDSLGQAWLGSPSGSGGSNIVVQNTVKPSAANSFNLGAAGDNFQQLYVNVATIGSSATVGGNPVGTITGVSSGNQMTGGGSSGSITLGVSSTPSFTTVTTNTLKNSGGDNLLSQSGGTGAVFVGDSNGSNPVASLGDFIPNGNNTYHLGNSSFKWIDVWAVNGTIQTSDARQKKDVVDEDLGLEFIRSLRPVSYLWNWEEAGAEREHGFVAQEVDGVLKEHKGWSFDGLVRPETPDGMYGMKYAQYTAPLVKGEQELADEVDALKKQVSELRAQVENLVHPPIPEGCVIIPQSFALSCPINAAH